MRVRVSRMSVMDPRADAANDANKKYLQTLKQADLNSSDKQWMSTLNASPFLPARS